MVLVWGCLSHLLRDSTINNGKLWGRAVHLLPDSMQRDRDRKWTRDDDAPERLPSITYFLRLDPTIWNFKTIPLSKNQISDT